MRTICKHLPLLCGLMLMQLPVAVAEPILRHEPLEYLEQRVSKLQSQFADKKVWSFAAVPVPKTAARVKTVPMFAAQQGSWPFEPLVRAGLFRKISGYQSHHPQMLVLSGGKSDLKALCTTLKDPAILDCSEGKARLKYPLLIEKGAALLVEDMDLSMDGAKGAAIINLGTLVIQRSSVAETVAGDDKRKEPHAFILNWAGSHLWLDNARLSGLGADAHLSVGLTVARSAQQAASTPMARVSISHCHFQNMWIGAEITQAKVQILQNTFASTLQQVLDIRQSNSYIHGNKLLGNGHQSAIRIQGGRSLITENSVLRAAKAAIELTDGARALLKTNAMGGGAGYGVLSQKADTLILEQNLVGAGSRNGIDVQNATHLALLNNKIIGRPEHGISIQHDEASEQENFVYGNTFESIGKSLIRTQGVTRLTLGNNSFVAQGLYQDVYGGDLTSYQGQILASKAGELVSLNLPDLHALKQKAKQP